MTRDAFPKTVLIVLGFLGLIKAVLGLANPDLLKRLSAWWVELAARMRALPVALCAALALLALVAVLPGQSLAHWLLLLYGLVFIWGAALYARPERMRELARTLLLEREAYMVRILCAILAVLCFAVVWIGIRA
jgi:hypothetical protein